MLLMRQRSAPPHPRPDVKFVLRQKFGAAGCAGPARGTVVAHQAADMLPNAVRGAGNEVGFTVPKGIGKLEGLVAAVEVR